MFIGIHLPTPLSTSKLLVEADARFGLDAEVGVARTYLGGVLVPMPTRG